LGVLRGAAGSQRNSLIRAFSQSGAAAYLIVRLTVLAWVTIQETGLSATGVK
jgi:hypothetical protein